MGIISSLVLFLNNYIQGEQNIITRTISVVLGAILNVAFEIVYFFTENFSLGIAIIVVTIVARLLMLPLAFKQQKSMAVMRKIQPEMRKIQEKYKNDMSDPEVKRKMNMEMQKLYAQHKYNPFSGCLPLLIQLPIFIALYYIMQNPFAFVDEINNNYVNIGNEIVRMANLDAEEGAAYVDAEIDYIAAYNRQVDNYEKYREKLIEEQEAAKQEAKDSGKEFKEINIDEEIKKQREQDPIIIKNYEETPKDLAEANDYYFIYQFFKTNINPINPENVSINCFDGKDYPKALDKLSADQWKELTDRFNSPVIEESLRKKEAIEYFGLGINLTETAGFGWPGIIITLLSGLTTFLSSWLMMRKNQNMDPAMKSQQKIMMITMPLLMAYITSGLPCGVGVYWITSNLFMIVQQQALNKYYEKKIIIEDGSKSKKR